MTTEQKAYLETAVEDLFGVVLALQATPVNNNDLNNALKMTANIFRQIVDVLEAA